MRVAAALAVVALGPGLDEQHPAGWRAEAGGVGTFTVPVHPECGCTGPDPDVPELD